DRRTILGQASVVDLARRETESLTKTVNRPRRKPPFLIEDPRQRRVVSAEREREATQRIPWIPAPALLEFGPDVCPQIHCARLEMAEWRVKIARAESGATPANQVVCTADRMVVLTGRGRHWYLRIHMTKTPKIRIIVAA